MSANAPHAPLLIVNHHTTTNDMVRRLLGRYGYAAVDVAETVSAALSLLDAPRRQPYALLLCRYALADGSAADLIPYAWTRYGTPGVAMTGTLTPKEIAARIKPAEALRGVLPIPFNIEALLALVNSACKPAAPATPCPDCRGTGEVTLLVSRRPCRRCGGTGRVRDAGRVATTGR